MLLPGPALIQTTPVSPATSLPASPADTQQAILVDSLTVPTYAFLLQYSLSAAGWLNIGSGFAFSQVATAETTASTSYTALSTAGPQFTMPRAGKYLLEFGCEFETTGSGGPDQWMTIKAGAAAASDTLAVHNNTHTASTTNTGSRAYTVTAAASDLYVAQYRTATFTPGWGNRWLKVTPMLLT